MSRADHRLDARGQCRRCGLTVAHAPVCPPGFWMTPAEASTWDYIEPSKRGAYAASLQVSKDPT